MTSDSLFLDQITNVLFRSERQMDSLLDSQSTNLCSKVTRNKGGHRHTLTPFVIFTLSDDPVLKKITSSFTGDQIRGIIDVFWPQSDLIKPRVEMQNIIRVFRVDAVPGGSHPTLLKRSGHV